MSTGRKIRRFFEQEEFWKLYHHKVPGGEERIRESINLIPLDVENILDTGCGEGSFINCIKTEYQVIGLDLSKIALKYAGTEVILASIANLPFKEDSFSLVTAFEILEHLPYKDYENALSEIRRVSKKYIMVSVPNQQPLEYYLVVCPKCYCRFTSSGHVRSFNHRQLKNLFETDSRRIAIKEVGEIISHPTYPHFLFGALRSWLKPTPPKTAICPQCGYQTKKGKGRLSYSNLPKQLTIVKGIADVIWRPRKVKYHLLALYERCG